MHFQCTVVYNPKDTAISLLLEAAELLEHFQWKNGEEITRHVEDHKAEIAEELADVFNYLLQMSHALSIDLVDASNKKIVKNGEKYPIDKSKNKHTKYTEL